MGSFRDFFPSDVRTLVSDRSINFALNEKQLDFIPLQQQYLSSQLGLSIEKIVNIRQVHSNHVMIATSEHLHDKRALRKADAVVTNLYDVPIAVRTADCLPIFIYDFKQKCIGLVHAGWRGSQKKVGVHTLNVMKKHWLCHPKDLLVAFGPGIRDCCYQVGEEFKNYFPEDITPKSNGAYLDLVSVNKRQLLETGVLKDHIFDCRICTCCDPNCFSYRREGEKAGRMISLMMIQS